MNTTTFMDSLFLDSDIIITDLKKGLTNQNFLLEIQGDFFVLRTPQFDSNKIVKRHHEALALEAIHGQNIDVETIYYDEASGYKVTKYLSEAQDFQQYLGKDKIYRTALLMKQFHSLHKQIGVSFDPINRFSMYHEQLHTPLYNLNPFLSLLDDVRDLSYDCVLCHNDWVEGNILFTSDHTYLIDYEYAADNDPLFDVMSFISENNIMDEAQRKCFYDTYFDEFNDDIAKRLALWESFHNLLWCTWAMMMWESRHEQIYKTIAKQKYDALCISIKK